MTSKTSLGTAKVVVLVLAIALAGLSALLNPAIGGVKLKSGSLFLYDDSTDRVVGIRNSDDTERYFPLYTSLASATATAVFTPADPGAIGGTTPAAGTFTTLTATGTLTGSSTVSLSPANANVTLSPTGTGTVIISPATAGTIDKMALGGTTPAAATVTTLTATSTVSLSPANATVTVAPTGTGTVVIAPATLGSMDKMTIGASTPAAATVTALATTGNAGIGGGNANHRFQVTGADASNTSPVIKVSSLDQSNGAIFFGDGSTAALNVGIARINGATQAYGAGGLGYFSQGNANVGGHYFYTADAAFGAQSKRFAITDIGSASFSPDGTNTVAIISSTGVAVTGTFTATGSIGYTTGAGGTVTQTVSKSDTVTLNVSTGVITTDAATLNTATIVSFPFLNSAVVADDMLLCTHHSGGTLGAYTINCRATGAGTAEVNIRNNTAGNLSEAIVIKFALIKSVTS